MKNIISIKNSLLASAFLFLLNGCATTQEQQPPEWVLAPMQDNQQYIYGIGEGPTLTEAKQRGLKEIASKFSISVNSDTLNKQTLHNGRSDQLFSQEINTQVKEIEFTHFEQKKAQKVNQQYFVQVAVSRAGFISDKKAKLTTITNNIDAILLNVKSKSKIEQLYAYNKVQSEITNAEPLLYLIAVADSTFDLTTYTKTFNKYSMQEASLLASTHFYIQSPSKLSPIGNALNDVIQTHGFQVSTLAKTDAIVKLQGSIKNNNAFSTYNSRIDFSFLVKSKQGSVYSKKSYSLNGSSVTSYQLAYEGAVKKFLTVIESRSDIYQLLGFDE